MLLTQYENNLEQYRMIKQGGMPHNEIINIYKANQYANMNFLKSHSWNVCTKKSSMRGNKDF